MATVATAVDGDGDVDWSEIGGLRAGRAARAAARRRPRPPSPARAVECAVHVDGPCLRVVNAAGTLLASGAGWRAGRRLFFVRAGGDADGALALRCATDETGAGVAALVQQAQASSGKVCGEGWRRGWGGRRVGRSSRGATAAHAPSALPPGRV
jgi:hypothetical protein